MPVRPLRRLILPFCLVAALGLVACGGDDDGGGGGGESSADATQLLEKAFATKIDAATLSMTADIQVDGVKQLEEGIDVKLSGPFVDNGKGKLPSTDLDFSFSGAGQSLSAGLTMTGDNAFVSFQGSDYEVGEQLYQQFAQQYRQQAQQGGDSLAKLGIDPTEWIEAPKVEGEAEDVEGAETTKVTGDVDVLKVIEDLGQASDRMGTAMGGENPLDLTDEQRREVEEVVEDASVEIYVSNDDDTVRRFVLDLEFEVPEDQRQEAGGAEGGSAKIDLTLSDVGEKREIEAPADARPLAELLSQFGLGGESFLQ